jgi:ubiquinone/menaquinone biosynthesis C-methylase UbiE
MTEPDAQRAAQFYAQTYDVAVRDWPGEIDFYRHFAARARACPCEQEAGAAGQRVLEVACGTGRLAIQLAQDGVDIAGLDLSVAMLEVAKAKSAGLSNVRWVQGDMRSFDLGETFGLAIIPGHAFQNILTPQDQVACLASIHRCLEPGASLIVHLDHQDVDWLGDLLGDRGGVFEEAEGFVHPATGRRIRTYRAWSYARATQTATAQTRWEEIGSGGEVVDRWQSDPVPLHCVFRFEMQHLLALTGYAVEALYGDFHKGEFNEASAEMIWVAKKR